MEVITGRKWRAKEAVDRAEATSRHNILVGTLATGRAGLGSIPARCYRNARGKDRQKLIQEEVEVEEVQRSRMFGMAKQEACTRWEQTHSRKDHLDRTLEDGATSLQVLGPACL